MSEDRLQNAIERLTEICSDMKVMIAAHEQRINQNEKDMQVIFKLLEHRRIEIDDKIDEAYTHMTEKDDKIISELKAHREAAANEHKVLNKRMAELERYIWLAIGGGITATWVLSQAVNYFTHLVK